MSAAFEKLRAIRVRIAALGAAGIDDYANLSALPSTPLRKSFRRRRHAAPSASASISPVI